MYACMHWAWLYSAETGFSMWAFMWFLGGTNKTHATIVRSNAVLKVQQLNTCLHFLNGTKVANSVLPSISDFGARLGLCVLIRGVLSSKICKCLSPVPLQATTAAVSSHIRQCGRGSHLQRKKCRFLTEWVFTDSKVDCVSLHYSNESPALPIAVY